MVRRQRRRQAGLAAGCLAAIGALTLATTQLATSDDRDRRDQLRVVDDPKTATTIPSPSTATPETNSDAERLAAANVAWERLRATFPSGTVSSPVAPSPEGPVAVIGIDEAALVVYRFSDDAWLEVERFDTRLPLATGHFSVADVTGDGFADFLALDFPGADHSGGSVLSEHGGRWHLVAFAARTYLERGYLHWERDTYVTWLGLEDAAGRTRYGSVVTTRSNDCTPSCADGTLHQDHWRFDAETGDFVSVTHHVWPETVPDRLFAAWQRGDRAVANEVAVPSAVYALFAHDPYEAEWNLYGACREPSPVDVLPTCTAYTQPGLSLELVTDLVGSETLVTEAQFIED